MTVYNGVYASLPCVRGIPQGVPQGGVYPGIYRRVYLRVLNLRVYLRVLNLRVYLRVCRVVYTWVYLRVCRVVYTQGIPQGGETSARRGSHPKVIPVSLLG